MAALILEGAMAQHAGYLDRYCGQDLALRAAVATAIYAESGGRLDGP